MFKSSEQTNLKRNN